MTEPTDRLHEIFNEALDLPSGDARDAFLAGAILQSLPYRPELQIRGLPDDKFELSWDADPFLDYQVQYRDAMADGTAWMDFGSAITSDGATTTMRVEMEGVQHQRFFRVIEAE